MDKVISIRLSNSSKEDVDFVLEPWGEVYKMPPETVFEVLGRGPDGDTIEVETAPGKVVVYGWPGSILELYSGGSQLGVEFGQRLPAPGPVASRE